MSDALFNATLLALCFIPQILAISWSIAAWKNYFSGIVVLRPILVAALAIAYSLFLPGQMFRKIILVVLVSLWAMRLSAHLFLRLKNKFPEEDSSSERLKSKWGTHTLRNFFIFYQFQGSAALVLAFPFWIYIKRPEPQILWSEIVGIFLFTVALAGETIADEQLRRFKKEDTNRGKILQQGLWKYTRHPNYFCEWLIWASFALMAVSAPHGSLALLAPAMMWLMLWRWTGVPHSETQAKSTRGESHREYQQTTNSFFPWFANNESRADPS